MSKSTSDPNPRRAGDREIIEVEALLATGEGSAEDGRMRIRGAMPGEKALVRIEHIGKNATFATTVEILRARMARRSPPCAQHIDRGGRCTGCALMPTSTPDQRTLLADMLKAAHGLEVGKITAAPEQEGYRQSAKRIAFGGPGKLKLGSFMRGSHRPADMEGCLVDHPRIREAADDLAEAARALGIRAFDERTGVGMLRAVWFKTDGQRVLATLVTADPATATQISQDPAAKRAEREIGHDAGTKDTTPTPTIHGELLRLATRVPSIDGFAWNVHLAGSNRLRGGEAVPIRGIQELTIDGERFGPVGFLQPNPKMAQIMVQWLIEGCEGNSALDLYAGSGTTTTLLRQHVGTVIPCESNPESAKQLGVAPSDALSFLAAQHASPDVVVANPPRKGLGEAVCGELLRLSPSRIHIMACGPAGLASDLERLGSGYTVESLRAFDTLPQTPHVELIAKLVRNRD